MRGRAFCCDWVGRVLIGWVINLHGCITQGEELSDGPLVAACTLERCVCVCIEGFLSGCSEYPCGRLAAIGVGVGIIAGLWRPVWSCGDLHGVAKVTCGMAWGG